MSDWRDWEPGRVGVSVAQLSDGESLRAMIISEPFRSETEHSDDALHVPVTFLEIPDGFEDMSGDAVDTPGDVDGDTPEYNIINSSTAFFNALTEAFENAESIDGQTMVVTAHQEGPEQTARSYTIEPA